MSGDNIQKSWFSRLKEGLSASSNKVVSGITGIFTEKRLDEETLEQLEDLLISSDLGVNVASRLITVSYTHLTLPTNREV